METNVWFEFSLVWVSRIDYAFVMLLDCFLLTSGIKLMTVKILDSLIFGI